MARFKKTLLAFIVMNTCVLGSVHTVYAGEDTKTVGDVVSKPLPQQSQSHIVSPPLGLSPQLHVAVAASPYDVFTPKSQTSDAKLDYTVWDTALRESVVKMGPSLRIRAPRNKRGTIGSRIVRGHKSPYRLEGSRITFSYLPERYVEALSAYREDLVQIANEQDLQSFSRKEQLAFWMNLHNVLVVETIAKNYPVKKPSNLVIGPHGERLHEAKLVTIKSVPLSLRDIRENIVYKNWSSPVVIYGFYRGDIGGPGIMDFALTGENVDYVLHLQAFEFITSLRGFNTTRFNRNISELYSEARPYYFQNWPAGVETHLRQFANESTLRDLDKGTPFRVEEYDQVIADLWGGTRIRGSAAVYSRAGANFDRPPILFERRLKINTLRRRGMLKRSYSVTITDIETSDESQSKAISDK